MQWKCIWLQRGPATVCYTGPVEDGYNSPERSQYLNVTNVCTSFARQMSLARHDTACYLKIGENFLKRKTEKCCFFWLFFTKFAKLFLAFHCPMSRSVQTSKENELFLSFLHCCNFRKLNAVYHLWPLSLTRSAHFQSPLFEEREEAQHSGMEVN